MCYYLNVHFQGQRVNVVLKLVYVYEERVLKITRLSCARSNSRTIQLLEKLINFFPSKKYKGKNWQGSRHGLLY